ncbi:MAG: hypothetical protein QOF41_3487 [Methylobacteriaceae bacterium]|nr:hypothetical protein [Methylobacteriaceae bacterium]
MASIRDLLRRLRQSGAVLLICLTAFVGTVVCAAGNEAAFHVIKGGIATNTSNSDAKSYEMELLKYITIGSLAKDIEGFLHISIGADIWRTNSTSGNEGFTFRQQGPLIRFLVGDPEQIRLHIGASGGYSQVTSLAVPTIHPLHRDYKGIRLAERTISRAQGWLTYAYIRTLPGAGSLVSLIKHPELQPENNYSEGRRDGKNIVSMRFDDSYDFRHHREKAIFWFGAALIFIGALLCLAAVSQESPLW